MSCSRQPGEIIVLFSLSQEYFCPGYEAFGFVWVVKCGVNHCWLFWSLTCFFFSFSLKRYHDIFFFSVPLVLFFFLSFSFTTSFESVFFIVPCYGYDIFFSLFLIETFCLSLYRSSANAFSFLYIFFYN